MSTIRNALCSLAVASVAAIAQAAPVLQIDSNGVLTGALGVNVSGVSYDVQFRDGSCREVMCWPGPLLWGQQQLAVDMSTALLDQVFIGAFDDDPFRINGCTDLTLCIAMTAYSEEVGDPIHPSPFVMISAYARNFALGQGVDDVLSTRWDGEIDPIGTNPQKVWAVWSRSVPEPSSILCAAVGLAALALMRRPRGIAPVPS